MKIYEYLILPGAGSRIRRLHQKILYKYAQGANKKKKKKNVMANLSLLITCDGEFKFTDKM